MPDGLGTHIARFTVTHSVLDTETAAGLQYLAEPHPRHAVIVHLDDKMAIERIAVEEVDAWVPAQRGGIRAALRRGSPAEAQGEDPEAASLRLNAASWDVER